MDSVSELSAIIREILRDLGRHVKAHDKCLVVAGMDGLIQKFDRGFLLELEAVAYRVAGVNQQADLQRQIGFGVKASNLLRRFVIVQDFEVVLLEIGDPAAMLIRDREYDVHLVGGRPQGGERVRVCSGALISGFLLRAARLAAGG